MAGIYLHIPFCKKKCHYCDFYKSTDLSSKIQLLKAIQSELTSRKRELDEEVVHTIYFGGGTPSVLSVEEIADLLNCIHENYQIADDAEITMECNPDDLSVDYLKGIRQKGINRLSIGIQSFSEFYLNLMNRRHKAEQAINAVNYARQAGFDNISIDLIYGLPDLDLQSWQETIQQAIALDVQHISAYHLTYHEGTIFYDKLRSGTLKELPDELSLEQFKILKQELIKAGFEQYEISNFAKDKLYSKHNTAYWKQVKYLGAGPSAHSYDVESRRWNVSSVGKYLKAIENNKPYYESEKLSKYDRYNDYIITRLRTIWGVKETEIDVAFLTSFRNVIYKYCESGHMIKKEDTFTLSDEGLFISDKIMEDLIITE